MKDSNAYIIEETQAADCDHNIIHHGIVAAVQRQMAQQEDFYDLAALYKMFGDSTRLRILWALSREDMCVCDLAAALGMTKSAISHQLKQLRLGNLVRFTRQGKTALYSLADSHVRDILDLGFEHINEK